MRALCLAVCGLLVACSGPTAPAARPAGVAVSGVPPHDAGVIDGPASPDGAVSDAAPPPPSPSPPRVTVLFSVRPRVGPGAPVLRVDVNNPGPGAVPFTRFADAGCFARHYLAIEVRSTNGVVPSVARCAIRSWPGAEGTLAAGERATVEVPLRELYGNLARGVYEIDVDWDASELERMRPGTAVAASTTSLDVSSFAIAKVLSQFRVKAGKSAKLPGGGRLSFGGHGHKHAVAGGPPSPLMVAGTFARPGKPAEEFSVNVHVEETPFFSIDDYVFELVGYEYDAWMELRYFGTLVLD